MKSAAATVADRFHTDAEPDTLVFLYDSWKRRVSAVIVLSVRPFVLLRYYENNNNNNSDDHVTAHVISHFDPTTSYHIPDWQTAYDDPTGATSHSSVTDSVSVSIFKGERWESYYCLWRLQKERL